MIRRVSAAAALLSAASLLPSPAVAANKDIERLQVLVAALQSQVMALQRDNDESRKELKRLTDLIAEQNALLQRMSSDRRQQDELTTTNFKDLSDRIGVVAEALQALKASFLPAGPAPTTPGAAAGGPAAPNTGLPLAGAPSGVPPAPRELFNQAYADFTVGNYDLAIQGFTDHVRNYPDSDIADNAQFWVGRCLEAKKQYAEAIEAWNLLLRTYPKSDKIAETRLKKGAALERLGRRSQALLEYRYVIDHFPGTPAATEARAKLNP